MTTYLADLDDTVPVNTDKLKTCVPEIQQIKGAFLDTFPNVTGPVTVTDTELNHCANLTSNVQTQIDSKEADVAALEARGTIHVAQKLSTTLLVEPGWSIALSEFIYTITLKPEYYVSQTDGTYYNVFISSSDISLRPVLISKDREDFSFGFHDPLNLVTGPPNAFWVLVKRDG